MAHRIRIRVFAIGGKSTKFADIFADVGRIDVSVDVKKGFVAMFLAPSSVRILTKGKKVKLV